MEVASGFNKRFQRICCGSLLFEAVQKVSFNAKYAIPKFRDAKI
jgi:hypothetical protein